MFIVREMTVVIKSFNGRASQYCVMIESHFERRVEIAYGFPGAEFDFDKYEVGGCCVSDNDPDFKCMKCESSW